MIGGEAFGAAPFGGILGGGLVYFRTYLVQAGEVLRGDRCPAASWTALFDAEANIAGASQALESEQSFAQVVVRSWEDNSVRTRIWDDSTLVLTIRRGVET